MCFWGLSGDMEVWEGGRGVGVGEGGGQGYGGDWQWGVFECGAEF